MANFPASRALAAATVFVVVALVATGVRSEVLSVSDQVGSWPSARSGLDFFRCKPHESLPLAFFLFFLVVVFPSFSFFSMFRLARGRLSQRLCPCRGWTVLLDPMAGFEFFFYYYFPGRRGGRRWPLRATFFPLFFVFFGCPLTVASARSCQAPYTWNRYTSSGVVAMTAAPGPVLAAAQHPTSGRIYYSTPSDLQVSNNRFHHKPPLS